MAAGSVMNEPSKGVSVKTITSMPQLPGSGVMRARRCSKACAACKIGRVAAITMMTNTKIGSVKLRVSMYCSATGAPSMANISTISSMAQRPNTTSTSPSQCHSPACAG